MTIKPASLAVQPPLMPEEPAVVATNDRRLLGALVRVVIFIFLAKLVGAAKEVAMAAIYGTTAPVAAYLLVWRIYDLPIGVWMSTLGVTFVPMFFRWRHAPAELALFHREVAGAAILGGSGLALLAAIGVPLLLGHQSIGLSAEVTNLSIQMATPLALAIPIGALMGVIFNRLIAGEQHVASLFDGLPPLVLLIALLVLRGPDTLVWGTVAGYAVAVVVLYFTSARRQPMQWPAFSFSSPLWKGFARASAVVAGAGLFLAIAGTIDQLMVAYMGPEAIATLGYANRLLAVMLGLGTTALARVVTPILSDAEASSAQAALALARKWSLIFFAVGILAATAGWLTAPWMVKVIYQRGAFTAADTAAVAEMLRYAFLVLPFHFAGMVIAQLWAARGRYTIFLGVNAGAFGVKLAANALLVGPLGIKGVLIGTTIMYATCLALLWGLALQRRRVVSLRPQLE